MNRHRAKMPRNVQPWQRHPRRLSALLSYRPDTGGPSLALERYRQKRDFGNTPEPPGTVVERRPGALEFVIQKHAATRLHYDFRLELDGVMLSWAVPKGPSLDPNDKRLAMHVEDHPLEYAAFEGVIPPRQYGAGTVMVWDRGTWTPASDAAEAYAKGHLKFELHGEKLGGVWNLVRSRSDKYGDKSWLLFKEADAFARLGRDASIVDDRPDSVVSGRTLDEIAAQSDRVWHSNQSVASNVSRGAVGRRRFKPTAVLARIEGARRAALPESIEAQLATASSTPPVGAAWVHEVKHDGYRMLCRIVNGEARMMSRSGKDWTSEFVALARAAARLPVESAWLDGEAVVVDEQGRSRFQALQNALSGSTTGSLAYYAFDLLYVDGVDLRGVKLSARKRLLEQLLAEGPATLRYSEHFAADGPAFLESIRALGLEGMVSKRADLPYRAGRGAAWQKIKCLRRQEFVIGGYTDPEGSRAGFGALLLGLHEEAGPLRYAGRVGTGFDDATLASIARSLQSLAQRASPFANPPQDPEGRRAHWVKPVLVAEVAFAEWTNDGTLRHPSFVGLRGDKQATEVIREDESERGEADNPPVGAPPVPLRKAKTRDAVLGVALSNPDKVLYPEAKLTKRDLASYYAAIGDWMLPHLRNRPLTLVRCPNGWDKCFYQKNAEDGLHETLSRVMITHDDGSTSPYVMANSVPAIVALLQMGVLEVHPWGSRAAHLGFADRITFDLDPDESLPWDRLTEAVAIVRTLLDNVGLASFLKTTGGKGLHVVVPIEPSSEWEHVKGFTKAVAELLERTFPDRFTSKLLKVSRRGRIFIDYLRNAEGSTAVAAYSLRAKANAPVSLPIAWDELSRDVRFDRYNARNVPKRLAKLRADPWSGIANAARPLAGAMAKVGYAPSSR
jgi:bifunctional non-homologous end joining protein LigD